MATPPRHKGTASPADLPRRAEDDAPDPRQYAEAPTSDAADGTQKFAVLTNSETGETVVAPDSDVSNPSGEGFDQTHVHTTPGGAERDAEG